VLWLLMYRLPTQWLSPLAVSRFAVPPFAVRCSPFRRQLFRR